MLADAGFRTVQAMDEKLAVLAKCTVFARCSRRELTELGRLVEVATLASGEMLPAARARWTFLVLDGRGLVATDGSAHCILGEGDLWSSPGTAGLPERGPIRERLVALTDLTVLVVETRALAAVKQGCPSAVWPRRMHIWLPGPLEHLSSRSAGVSPELVGSTSHG
jgi:hypothetical protein